MRAWLLVAALFISTGVQAHTHRHHHSVAVASSATQLPHPSGCPRTEFCGCGTSVEIFGHSVRSLWLASNWFRIPTGRSAPGMVAVQIPPRFCNSRGSRRWPRAGVRSEFGRGPHPIACHFARGLLREKSAWRALRQPWGVNMLRLFCGSIVRHMLSLRKDETPIPAGHASCGGPSAGMRIHLSIVRPNDKPRRQSSVHDER